MIWKLWPKVSTERRRRPLGSIDSPIEATSFGYLHLVAESLEQVLINDTIGSGKESQDVGDEVSLVVVESVVPVMKIL